MSRYRPPATPASKYITPEGAARLKSELDALWRVERPQVTAAVTAAAAQGEFTHVYVARATQKAVEIPAKTRAVLEGLRG